MRSLQLSQPSFQTCLFSNKLMCLPGWSTFEFGNLVSQDKSKASLNELAIYTVEPQIKEIPLSLFKAVIEVSYRLIRITQ